jgi:hypothetical protein
MSEPLKTTCPLCNSEVVVTVTPQTSFQHPHVAMDHKKSGCIMVQRASFKPSDPRYKKVKNAMTRIMNNLFPQGSEDKYGL